MTNEGRKKSRSGDTRRIQLCSVFATCLLSTLAIVDLPAQLAPSSSGATWDPTAPRGRTRLIEFTASEGTWTSVDLSADGSWITFDLLGHVYRMPAAGGNAVALTQSSGIASNFHPRISPDGKSIAFISDRAGGDYNLWVMDGRNAHAVAVAPKIRMKFPHWTPDNQFIVVGQDGGEQYELVMYHRDGGAGITLLKGVEGRRPFRPSLSADGRYLYYDVYTSTNLPEGHADALKGAVQVHRGGARRLTPTSFDAMEFQPAWSPDGRTIAFTTVDSVNRGALWRIAASGGTPERVSKDAGEYLNPSWTPDGREIVVARGAGATARGQALTRNPYWVIVRMPASGGEETEIAQRGRVGNRSVELRPMVGNDGRVYWATPNDFGSGEQFGIAPRGVEFASVRMDGSDRRVHASIRDADDAVVSPDGKWLAFMQGANVYVAPLPAGVTGGSIPKITKEGGDLPVTALSTGGGLYPRWRTSAILDFAGGAQF